MKFEIGIQIHLPTFRHLTLRELIDVARDAHAGGVSQIWVTDNLRSRNQFVILTALAAHVPVKLGTAITVQYFRNPVDVADCVAAITELMDGREFSRGFARGNRNTPNYVKVVKPLAMLRETALSTRRLLAGEAVRFADYPAVSSYFNLVPEASFQLNFKPQSPVLLWEFPKHCVARRIVTLREDGFGDDDYGKLGIEPVHIDRLLKAEKSAGGFDQHLDLVTDAMVDSIFVAGDPAQCVEKMREVCATAGALGFGQLMFSELGPDLREGLRMLCERIVPSL